MLRCSSRVSLLLAILFAIVSLGIFTFTNGTNTTLASYHQPLVSVTSINQTNCIAYLLPAGYHDVSREKHRINTHCVENTECNPANGHCGLCLLAVCVDNSGLSSITALPPIIYHVFIKPYLVFISPPTRPPQYPTS